MLKTILVPMAGSETDEAVGATALAAARLWGAHLDFLHVFVTPVEAAANTPHVEFAMGTALRDALARVRQRSQAGAEAAKRRFQNICEQAGIVIAETPSGTPGVRRVGVRKWTTRSPGSCLRPAIMTSWSSDADGTRTACRPTAWSGSSSTAGGR